MEFFKNFFKDDDKVIGLCAFTFKKSLKKQSYNNFSFPGQKLAFTNTQKNIFLI